MLLEQLAQLVAARKTQDLVNKSLRKAFWPHIEVLVDMDEEAGTVTLRLGKDEITIPQLMAGLEKLGIPAEHATLCKVEDELGRHWLGVRLSISIQMPEESEAEGEGEESEEG